MVLGGVNSWSIEMTRKLSKLNKQTTLVRYPDLGQTVNSTIPSEVSIVNCNCGMASQGKDLLNHLPVHYEMLPALIVPNFHTQPYGICALLSIHEVNALRILGVCHSDQIYFYALLHYYEPIIHKFIAVSDEISTNLEKIIPHRKNDIVMRPCGVSVPQTIQRTYSGMDEPLRLTYAGRIVESQKCVSTLVKLAQALIWIDVNFHMRIIGDGNYKKELIKQIKNSALYNFCRHNCTFGNGYRMAFNRYCSSCFKV